MESRGLCYAIRSLRQVKRCKRQTEKKELTSVIHYYLYGLHNFDLVTDHEAQIFIPSRTLKPSVRKESWVKRLQTYNYQVYYKIYVYYIWNEGLVARLPNPGGRK